MKQILMSIRVFSFGLAIAATLLVGGCGESDSSEITGQTGSLTKAEFIRRADAICRKGGSQVQREFAAYVQRNSDAVSPESPQSEQGAAAAEIIDTIYVPGNEKQIERIGSLSAPSGDEGEVKAILAAMQDGLDEASDRPLVFIRAGSPKGPAFTEARKLARAYGLADCGQG